MVYKKNSKGAVYEIEIDLDNPLLNIKRYDEKEIKELFYHCRNGNEDLANEFIEDFENADIIYGRMLGSISSFEKYISQFHGENFSVLHNSDKIKFINYKLKCDIVTFENLENKMEFIGTKKMINIALKVKKLKNWQMNV